MDRSLRQALDEAWIWDDSPPRAYNAWRWFRHEWQQGTTAGTQLVITADSRYRLWVNGHDLGDGPVRAWPERYRADLLDLGPWLRKGKNEILVLARFYGCGTFHVVPQRGGLSAVLQRDGLEVWRTNQKWRVRLAGEYPANTPRISVQLPAMEMVDARQENRSPWQDSVPLRGPVPWTLAAWRDVAPPRQVWREWPVRAEVNFVARREPVRCVPLLRLLYPGVFTQALRMTRVLALASEVTVTRAGAYPWFDASNWDVFVDGNKIDAAAWRPRPGRHRVVAVYRRLFDDLVDAVFGYPEAKGLQWRRPSAARRDSGEVWVPLTERSLLQQGDDYYWMGHPSSRQDLLLRQHRRWAVRIGRASGQEKAFVGLLDDALPLPPGCPLFSPDPDAEFRARRVVRRGTALPRAKRGWVIPARAGADTELHFDLGDQLAGYYGFEIEAPAGTVIDLNLVEHIRPDGVVQHTTSNRNGLRYVARGGRRKFLSSQRRSGRHLFLTVRGTGGPVVLRSAGVLESSYPAVCPVPFECSDPALNSIWRAAARTMELSMDDVYIDSLYEQTLWVGDARVEQLYGLRTFDARDISLRSLRLAADSLSRSPMVLSQVPTCWENIIPVWSFLWVIAVWDYFDYTGDAKVLREFWPAVRRNLRGAVVQLDERGLFEAPWWNLFEWADVDNNHRTVLYNTQFFLGAVQAARKMEAVLDDVEERGWLAALETRLRQGIEAMWDAERELYVESLDRKGAPSRRFSIHPQFLAVLYEAAEEQRAEMLIDKIARPSKRLAGLASAFALQFYGEALDRAGRRGRLLALLRKYFDPMTAIGTTLWEALPGSRTSPPGFPTRSHCHGWSACALDFLPLIVLGIRSIAPGSRRFTVSPEPHGLTHARGCRTTPYGPVSVSWQITGRVMTADIVHPAECLVEFVSNEHIAGWQHDVNIRVATS